MNIKKVTPKVFYFFVFCCLVITCKNNDSIPLNPSDTFNIEQSELPKLEKEALLGSPEAAFKLYQYYSFSKLDNEKSIYWITIASENGHDIAQHTLAYMLMNDSENNNRIRAKFWAKKSANNGNKDALELLKEIK